MSKYVKQNLKTFRREYRKIYLWAQNKEYGLFSVSQN